MDYKALLELTTQLGYRLAISGAETFRVEESIVRIFAAYGIKAEVFSIPNCLIVSVETPDKEPLTQMCRIGHHGTDLDAVEKYSNLSRRICAAVPDPQEALQWLKQIENTIPKYSILIFLLANVVASFGFTFLFSGRLIDAACAGLCGLVIGLISRLMSHFKINVFFATIASGFAGALLAYILAVARQPSC